MNVSSFLFIYVFCITSAISAQSVSDFSGTWVQDKVKSEGLYKDFDVTTVIVQTLQTISVKMTFFDENGAEIITRESSFNLDGKEVSKQEEGGISKDSAKWSIDKKSITTTSTKTYTGNDPIGSTSTYSLSGDGLVLTVKTADINPMAASTVQVYNKKK